MRDRTYVMDITDVLEYARHNSTLSGIQRVSLRAIGHLVATRPGQVRLIAYHPLQGKVVELATDWCSPDYDFSQDDFFAWFGIADRTLAQWVRRNRGNPFTQAYDWVRAGVNYAIGRSSFFRKRNIVLTRLPAARSKIIGPYEPGESDVIVVLGGIWGFPDFMKSLQRMRKAGAKVLFFIHDIIPEKLPWLVAEGAAPVFQKWLRQAYEMADGIITNSRYTEADVKRDMKEKGHDLPVAAAQLAHEFMPSPGVPKPPRTSVVQIIQSPYVLCIGTIEGRKNLWALVRVWEALGRDLGLKTPRLVLAGKYGWGLDEFQDFMRATGNVGGLVTVVDRPSDSEIVRLIENCMFTVYPSFYEGWGLPIGESLWLGKTCVASNTSSMPEVGQDMCAYVDPSDLSDMMEGIKRMLADPEYRASFEQRIDRTRLRTWEDFSRSLSSAIDELVA